MIQEFFCDSKENVKKGRFVVMKGHDILESCLVTKVVFVVCWVTQHNLNGNDGSLIERMKSAQVFFRDEWQGRWYFR
jgi:hypothetical protein